MVGWNKTNELKKRDFLYFLLIYMYYRCIYVQNTLQVFTFIHGHNLPSEISVHCLTSNLIMYQCGNWLYSLDDQICCISKFAHFSNWTCTFSNQTMPSWLSFQPEQFIFRKPALCPYFTNKHTHRDVRHRTQCSNVWYVCFFK